ncbi:hypothetical protein [Treponema pedis]|uniref:Uncharacterized protein n=3 Tax=Treponema pedis TaxID=409322 RepID=S5ZRH7_9SPIR|nr:hypothetical protein [Treponema pedis]AGT42620.1 hypothetical protein TPE_0124 [Treponema pedis str. T A4]QSI03513.1 hypothetical protein DYQ05_00580 [Treponema pedis]
MKRYVVFFCIIFIVFVTLILDISKNEKLIFYNTNINTVYFDSIKLDVKGSSESIRLNKNEYDNSIWDIGFNVLEENLPADFKYNGILKLMVFDEKSNLIMLKEITALEHIVFSDKDLSNIKIAAFCRDVFKISGDYVDLVLLVEQEDKQLSNYSVRCFLGSIVTP